MSDGTATLPEREVRERRAPEERPGKETILTGTMISGPLGALAAVLAIIGLANVYPFWMVTLATIALGVCFLFEGMTLVGRLSPLREAAEERRPAADLGAGTTGVMLAGLIGIVLGILGLLGVRPAVLIPSAAIVFGAALVIGAGASIRINDVLMTNRQERLAAGQEVLAATGLRGLTGLGAMILGVIALIAVVPMTLSLVAMLITGVTLLLTDAAIAGRMLSVFRR